MKSEIKFSTNHGCFAREDRFDFWEQALRAKARDWIEEMMNEELDSALGIERYGRDENLRAKRLAVQPPALEEIRVLCQRAGIVLRHGNKAARRRQVALVRVDSYHILCSQGGQSS